MIVPLLQHLHRRNAISVVILFTIGEIVQHETLCNNCGKKGHYAKVCKSKVTKDTTVSMFSPIICLIAAACPDSLMQASVKVTVCENDLVALLDSGSSGSFINESVAKQLHLKIHQSTQNISIALTSLKTRVIGHCFVDINLNQHAYSSVRLGQGQRYPRFIYTCACTHCFYVDDQPH